MLIFRFILVFWVSTRTCLHTLMFKKNLYFPHAVCLNIPVFTLLSETLRFSTFQWNCNRIALLGNSLGPCLLPVS